MAAHHGGKRAREACLPEFHDILREHPDVHNSTNLFDDYNIGRAVGFGAYATVRQVENKLTGDLHAVKTIDKLDIVGNSTTDNGALLRMRQIARVKYKRFPISSSRLYVSLSVVAHRR